VANVVVMCISSQFVL